MKGPEKVYRETCEHCQYRSIINGCDGCLAKIAYDCEDERKAKIYYNEQKHLQEQFHNRQTHRRHLDMKSGHISWGKL